MFSMSLMGVVNKIVEHELVGKGRYGEALHMHLDLRMQFHDNLPGPEEHKTSRGLHFLYYLPKGYSYISVFTGITETPFGKLKDVAEWKHEITHDSCWRDIGTVTDLYFAMADEVIESVKKTGYKKKLAPIDCDEHNNFALFHSLYEWVPVEVRKDPNDSNNYRKIITLK